MATAVPEIDPENPSKPSPAAFAKARATRPEVCGSYAPERPYPIYLRGVVERGFGRGGKDLGCPTANLPTKVMQAQPALQRTGIYFGFARILPQDPDDPDLEDVIEGQTIHEGQPYSTDSESTNHTLQNDYLDDDVDVQTDDDGDEVVLSASPVYGGSDVDLVNLSQTGESVLPSFALKQRQMSRSSARSSRSVRTILEKAGAMNLERTTSGGSGAGKATSSESSPVSPTNPEGISPSLASAIFGKNEGNVSAPQPTKQSSNLSTSSASSASTNPTSVSTDKHPRDTSATSSQASSMRRKKKRRVPIISRDARVYPMVMSVGWNPFYNNTTKTAEVHIIHKFSQDFYGLEMRVVVLGYIRPEYNYVSKEALIDDIEMDKKVAFNSLARSPYQDYVADPFLLAPS
ncbi:hypothetical protein L7F22_039152 [Adiantum nelumboides]|nr:hypothetical protein [Adiantum nelumboides]